MKNNPYVWLLVFFSLLGFYSCEQEENEVRTEEQSNFFDAYGSDEAIVIIASYLKQKNDSTEFIRPFMEQFGYPLWRDAISLHDDKDLYIVPVKKEGKTEALWLFESDSIQTMYTIFPREVTTGMFEEEIWMFEYFDTRLGLDKPEWRQGRHMEFREVGEKSSTRAYIAVTKCNDIYSYWVGSTGEIHNLTYQGRHCWTEYQYFVSIAPPQTITPHKGIASTMPTIKIATPSQSTSALSALAKKLIKTNKNLTDAQLKKLSGAVDKMLADCIAQAIFNFLANRGYTIGVGMNNNIGTGGESAAIDWNGNMTFKNDDAINEATLFHEMFHHFQIKMGVGAMAGRDRYIGMMEFERVLFDDIYFNIHFRDEEGVIPYSAYENKVKPVYGDCMDRNAEEEYYRWLKDLTKEWRSYPQKRDFDSNRMRYWADFFGEHYSGYNGGRYNYSLDYDYAALHAALNLAAANCRN